MTDKTTAVENNQKASSDKSRIPTGSLILRTLAMPADTKVND